MNTNFEITCQRGAAGKGICTPLDNNFYDVVLGALEFGNSTGAVYDLESAANIIERSTIFQRRMKDGFLRGELGHPVERECRDYSDYVRRIHTIDERNVAILIRRVWIDRNYVCVDGSRCIAIRGEIAPAGPRADVIERALKNPYDNLAFSVRSMTTDRIVGGVRRKYFDNIITWDVVNEPGLSVATKFNSPACESMDVSTLSRIPVTKTLIETLRNEIVVPGVSNESTQISMESSIQAFNRITGNNLARGRSRLTAW